jgi:hypothetical protein
MITQKTIESFFKTYQFSVQKEAIEIAERVKVHADGAYPKTLIDELRPNEPEVIKEYRKKIYKPYTKGFFNKIFTLLQKIAKSEDWRIDFPNWQGATPENERIQPYISENYPYFDSLENYIFSIVLKQSIVDPNGIVLVLPLAFNVKQNEYYKPFAFVYSCEKVLYFEKDLLVVKKDNKGFKENYIFCDADSICFVEVGKSKQVPIVSFVEYKNTVGEIPAFHLGGLVNKVSYENDSLKFLYDSFVTPCLPYFDEASRLYSDHQANMVLNIHPEKYIFQNGECKTCAGLGHTKNEAYEKVTCNTCKGSGYKSSPFGVHEISPVAMNENGNIPTPPIGYIEKPLGLIEALKQEINDQCRQGLSSLGLEFLYEVPTAQSGVAKEYDREEINTFVAMVARHLVENIVKPIIWYTMQWRYKISLNEKDIKENSPIVRVPKKFDTLTSAILANRLKTAIENKYDYSTRKALEIQYAESEFGKDSKQVRMLKTLFELETMHDKTEDEKMTVFANNGVSQIDYVISANLQGFVIRAINENEGFLELPYKNKREKIVSYANEVIESLPKPIPIIK